MRIRRYQMPSLFGIPGGPDTLELTLNKREQAVCLRAAEIQDEARDRLRDKMGIAAFEESTWYTLSVHDLASGESIAWEALS